MTRRITDGMVQGMAWLSGTGPAGTVCRDCARAAAKRVVRGDAVTVTCAKSRPVNGQRVPFPTSTASCHHFEFRLDGGAA